MTSALAFHLLTAVVGVVIAAIVVVYIKGLRASPRDLWLLYGTKVLEYSAYAMINMTIVLYLTKNFGMGDVAAGTYFSVWSILINFFTIVIGAVTDTIGIKRTLLLGTITLIITRFILALSGDIYTATVFGFMPYAFGLAVMAPVISVGIKKMTTKETAAMGFALFYTLMNVGYAIGGWLWDKIRIGVVASGGSWTVPGLGAALAPYEAIFFAGFLLTLPSLLFLALLRDGVELDDKEQVVFKPQPKLPGGIFTVAKNTAVNALTGTAKSLKSTWSDTFFYKFLLIIFIVVFVRLVFFHLNSMTLPKYGLRLFGPGAKIGALYGVLNPVLVVILVPLVGYFFKKVPSYRMLLIGTTISALACFIGVMPGDWFTGLNGTLLSGIVFTEWLGVAGDPHPAYWPLLIFIFVFTIGEAIWSPRLMQFTAELAPKGKEGTYISLSILPFFLAKMFVGPMSGYLLETYVPVDAAGNALASYPDHYMVWFWVGLTALVSPIGLFLFRGLVTKHEAASKEG